MTNHFEDIQSKRRNTLIWIIGLLFIAANLRGPITSIGPLINIIRDDTGISNAFAGMITTIPLIAFTFISPIAPLVARKIGNEKTLLFSLVVLIGGILIRSVPTIYTLTIGMTLMGIAIAVGNVLLPGIIKDTYPQKSGLLTGSYIASMNLSSAIGFGVSIPLAQKAGLGWQGSLLCWAILAIATFVLWLPQTFGQKEKVKRKTIQKAERSNLFNNMWKSPAAWNITLFMGLQSLPFYILSAWLPDMTAAQGMTSEKSGWMLSILQFTSIPATFLTPIIAMRMSKRSIIGITAGLLISVGAIALSFGPMSYIVLWMIFIGIGTGMAISFILLMFGLRTENMYQASELSGMAQSIGYLLAAIGPILVGYMHDLTNSWALPKLTLIIISILLMISGAWAGQSHNVLKNNRYRVQKGYDKHR